MISNFRFQRLTWGHYQRVQFPQCLLLMLDQTRRNPLHMRRWQMVLHCIGIRTVGMVDGWWLGWPTKMHYLWCLQAMPIDSNYIKAGFGQIQHLSHSQLAQVPRSPDLVILILIIESLTITPTTMTTKLITLPMHVGVITIEITVWLNWISGQLCLSKLRFCS